MSALPSGTVTFLFTDVESSTKLLQAQPRAYAKAIARHHEILAAAVERHGGVVFETVGDAVYAAFAKPADALAAAVDGQRDLLSEPWAELGALRVRMGLHTGEVEVRGDHYFGAVMYRCARIMSAAHGGQLLLSLATAELVADADASVALRDLGTHRLKDLQRPEHLLQLMHPDLPSEFPPLRSLNARPNNLPVLRTEMVGREREIEEIGQLLATDDVRLVTLTGAGGIGKTRLALAVGAEALEGFAQGVFAVSLSALRDPALVLAAIAAALGVRETPGRKIGDTLHEYVRDKELLLVL
ncbi:MAG TPA: adenylate/guanylate cyclase domain-containing protein, partial [Candidatus Limnocylindria bacterium]|nr:adenylate/guanylate cyclase domain-containing protein [Candidatus Limnocylindria bacterium]